MKTPKRSTPASSSVVAPTTTVEMSENDASETSNVVENVAAKRELTPDLISSSPVKETSSVEIVVGQDSVANEDECKEEQNEKEEVLVEVQNHFKTYLWCFVVQLSADISLGYPRALAF